MRCHGKCIETVVCRHREFEKAFTGIEVGLAFLYRDDFTEDFLLPLNCQRQRRFETCEQVEKGEKSSSEASCCDTSHF